MQKRWVDILWVSVLTLGVGTTASLILPSVRLRAAILGGTMGATAGISIWRVRGLLDEQTEAIEKKIADLIRESSLDLSPLPSSSSLNGKIDTSLQETEISPPSSDFLERLNGQPAIDWLKKNNITVKTYRQSNSSDKILNELALFLGEKYDNLYRVYEHIKKNLSTGNRFSLNLASASQQEISDSTQFCYKLKSYAFLANYRYKNKIIYVTPQREGNIINFFTGGWFETFIFLKLAALFTSNSLSYSGLINPQILLPNGDDFELDILFLFADNEPVWIECKTGDYQSHITKYSDIRPLLSVSKERAFLIILGISDRLCEDLTKLYDITVLNQTLFLQRIAQNLELENIPVVVSEKKIDSEQLTTVLKKAGVRPFPEYRKQVIEQLIEIIQNLETPQTLIEIKETISQRLSYLSKSKIQDILNIIVQSGCILNTEGGRLVTFKEATAKLASYDLKEIEKKCLESYTYVILLEDFNYFSKNGNIEIFQDTVGGEIPDSAILKQLQDKIKEGMS